MKTFNTLQELFDYVPNCLVCGKQLESHLNGRLLGVSTFNKNVYGHPIHFRLKMKDETIVGKYKNHDIAINPVNNKIILGQELLSDVLMSWTSFTKKCYTCRCMVVTKYVERNPLNKKLEVFPNLILMNEEVHYTRKREKSVSITQNYYDDSSLLGARTFIVINNKPVKPLYVDFNKFKSLKHLNERLSTMLVFS